MKRLHRLSFPALLLSGMLLCLPVSAAGDEIPQPQSAGIAAGISGAQETPDLSPETVYETLIAFKDSYPEGTPYSNDDSYAWRGGIFSVGYGCAGFAFMLSDAAFGDLPARMFTDYDVLRVGDILRVENDTHFVIILDVQESYITVAEGNYNYAVHWGRKIPMSSVRSAGTTYGLTRYPEDYQDPGRKPVPGDLDGDREVTVTDAIILLRVVSEDESFRIRKPELLSEADLDGDGMLTVRDAAMLLAQLR